MLLINKYLENKTTKEIMELFTKYNIFDYIIKHYNVLHTMGGRAITDNIMDYIKNKKVKTGVCA
jgi:hypothetical protein